MEPWFRESPATNELVLGGLDLTPKRRNLPLRATSHHISDVTEWACDVTKQAVPGLVVIEWLHRIIASNNFKYD